VAALLTSVQQLLDSNLARDAEYTEIFCWVSLIPPANNRDSTLIRSRPLLSNSSPIYSSIYSTLSVS
jgi:hypothetical protein